MAEPKLSVVIPTRNRQAKLQATLADLAGQQEIDPTEYELIVVDDGSTPPVQPEPRSDAPRLTLERLEGAGPSAARNHGASRARGELLVFLDDDMRVGSTFLAAHWQAHLESPGALKMGFVRLPDSIVATPFGRFRQALEHHGFPQVAGPVSTPGVLIAANMAVGRTMFERLEGFDPALNTGEDRDLGLRHAERGGSVVYVPGAIGIHDDGSVGVGAYCLRAERYMQELVRFGMRHPGLPESGERAEVNGPVRLGHEPAGLSIRKLLKSLVMLPPLRATALASVRVLEAVAPDSGLLDSLYRVLLGAHLQRGYRRGLRSQSA